MTRPTAATARENKITRPVSAISGCKFVATNQTKTSFNLTIEILWWKTSISGTRRGPGEQVSISQSRFCGGKLGFSGLVWPRPVRFQSHNRDSVVENRPGQAQPHQPWPPRFNLTIEILWWKTFSCCHCFHRVILVSISQSRFCGGKLGAPDLETGWSEVSISQSRFCAGKHHTRVCLRLSITSFILTI